MENCSTGSNLSVQCNHSPVEGFSPNLLHHGYDEASLDLLHPEGVPANPPPTTQEDKIKFMKRVQEMKELIHGIVVRIQEEAHRQAAKYYMMRAFQLPINSWVWVYNPRALPPEGDRLEKRKLNIQWAGPYLYEGMKNATMARIERVDES